MSTKPADPPKEEIPPAEDLKDAKIIAKPKMDGDDMDMDDEEEALMAAMADEAEKLHSSQPNVEDSKSKDTSEKATPEQETKGSESSDLDAEASDGRVAGEDASESSPKSVKPDVAVPEKQEKNTDDDKPVKNGAGSAPVVAERVKEAEVEKDNEASSEQTSKDNQD
jgi:hypothetical protein